MRLLSWRSESGLINVIIKDQWTNSVLQSHPLIPPPRLCVCVCVHVFQCTIDDMKHQEADLQVQMKEQCEDYKELLSEKMARDMEIAAYRSGQSRVINLIKLGFFLFV